MNNSLQFKKACFLFVCCLFFFGKTNAQTYTFVGGSVFGEDWTDPFNWDNFSSPGPTVENGEIVFINANCDIPGSATVNIKGTLNFNSSSSLNMEISGTLEIEGNGFVNENEVIVKSGGEINIKNGGNLSFSTGSSLTNLVGGKITNLGLINVSSDVFFSNYGQLINQATCNLNSIVNQVSGIIQNFSSLNFGAVFGSSSFTFDNYGSNNNHISSLLTIEGELTNHPNATISNLPGSTLIITKGSSTNAKLINQGTINNLIGATTTCEADLVNDGNILNSGIINIVDNKKFTQASVLTNQPGGQINIINGKFDINAVFINNSIINIDTSGILNTNNSFQNSSIINSSGEININSGDFENENVINVLSGSTLTNNSTLINENAGDIQLEGTLTNWSQINNEADITIKSNGVFNHNSTLLNDTGGNINNQGTLTVNQALLSAGEISNTGLLTITTNGSISNANTIYNWSAGTLLIQGQLVTHDSLYSNGLIELEGTCLNTNKIINNNNASFIIKSTGSLTNDSLFDNRANMIVHGTVINNDKQTNASTLTIGATGNYSNHAKIYNWSAGTFLIQGQLTTNDSLYSNGLIELEGTCHNTNKIINNNNASFIINSTGSLTNDSIFDNKASMTVHGTFTNNDEQANTGTLTIETGGDYTNHSNFYNWSAGTFTNKGLFKNQGTHVNNGTITMSSAATYAGSGNVTGGLTNIQGTLSPGNSPGVITASGFVELKSTATYKVEIAGTGVAGTANGFDQVISNGARADGTLEIILLNGFVPTVGQQYIILNSSNTIFNTFSNIILPTGHDFTVTYNPNDITIEYIGAALPVTLVSFNAYKVDRTVQLDWQTSAELNNAGFEIQRLIANDDWMTLGYVDGKGTTNQSQEYLFVDHQPLSGDNYYRLKQIDFNDQFEFSEIIHVRMESLGAISFYPNPSRDFISFSGIKQKEFLVEVWDLQGKLRLRKQLSQGQNSIDVDHLAPGNYVVRYIFEKEWVGKRLIVVKE